jgi:transposase-like protein
VRVSQVAARHGVCESLVFCWRRQAREGVLVSPDVPVFLPVQMGDAAPQTVVSPSYADRKIVLRFDSPAVASRSDRDRAW